MTRFFSLTLALLLLANPVFAKTNQEKRDEIQEMRDRGLARLYKEQPETKDIIRKASGYATFSNIGVNVIFFSAGGGSGLVHNNKTGQETYMNMGTAGVGLGIGVKDFRRQSHHSNGLLAHRKSNCVHVNQREQRCGDTANSNSTKRQSLK